MHPVRITIFGGVAPRFDPRALPDPFAQTATNTKLWDGSLRPWKSTSAVVTPSKVGTKLSIYRFGQDVSNEAQYWFHWTTDVDVAKGPIAGDTSERTYFTGDGAPKVTDSSIALAAGTDYPMNSYTLGVPAPAATPSVAVSGTGSGSPVTKVYVYTYVTAWGEEGPPSTPSSAVNVQAGQTVTVSNMATGPGAGYNVTAKRIYRTISGQSTTDYRFVAEVAAATTSYADSIADSTVALNEALPSLEWSPPPSDMAGLVALPNGIMAGFSKNDLCLSEPFVPSAWPESYRLSTDWPVVGLGVIGQSVVILTKGKPYVATGSHPSSFTLERIDIGQACVAKRSIANIDGLGVVYASPAGLALISLGGSSILTDSFMDRDDWQALVPSSITGYAYNGRYFGFYSTGVTQGGFILDPKTSPPSLTFTDVYATAGYCDPIRDTLYLQVGNDIVKWDAGAGSLTYTWKSKVVVPTKPFNPAFAQVEAEAYPLTFKLYADGALKHTESVASAAAFRLPGGYKAREFEIELTGTQQVHAIYMGSTYRELAAI